MTFTGMVFAGVTGIVVFQDRDFLMVVMRYCIVKDHDADHQGKKNR